MLQDNWAIFRKLRHNLQVLLMKFAQLENQTLVISGGRKAVAGAASYTFELSFVFTTNLKKNNPLFTYIFSN